MGLDLYDRENLRAREQLADGVKDQANAYRERTEREAKTAHADQLAKIRMDALQMSYSILKQEPGTFSLNDVKRLADQLVDFAREGNQPTDGVPLNRFHGR